MPLHVRPAGAWVPAKDLSVRPGSTWLPAKTVWENVAGTWVARWRRFTATGPASIQGIETANGSIQTVSAVAFITADPADGVSYVWSHPTADFGVRLDAAGRTATVSFPSRIPSSRSGAIRCVVSRGDESITIDIPYTLSFV